MSRSPSSARAAMPPAAAVAIRLLATLGVGSAALAAQEPRPASPPVEFFASRRAALMEQIGGGDAIVLLRGAPKQPNNGDFYQDHEFYYLSGVAEPDLAMLLFPATGRDVLLVPPFNRFTSTWDGQRLAPGDAAAERTGFQEVGNVRLLHRVLDEQLAPRADGKRPVLWTLLSASPNRTATSSTAGAAARAQKRDRFDGRSTREEALAERLRERYEGVEIRDLSPYLNGGRVDGGRVPGLRAIKAPAEIAQIRASTTAAVHGIAEAMKSARPGLFEYQLAAVARYTFSRLGAGPDAYAAIVGAGANGCVLHYNANRKQLGDSELVVMDYGPTVHGYATDVTRTFPTNGTFTDAQRKLVVDVWEVQQELIRRVRPGARLGELSQLCSRLLRDNGYRVDHGPCHHVGLAVHDVGPDELQPGMVITVEPGAYLRDAGMGCRIEDVVLVTADGCEVLSADLPSHPDEVEELMKLEGLAARPIGLPPAGGAAGAEKR